MYTLMEILPPRYHAWLMKLGFNIHPAYWGTGGRVEWVADNVQAMRVRLPLNWRTRNVVGTIYGGSIFAITDGPTPAMIMYHLGKEVIVWDKSASIRYRKPGTTTLRATFTLDDEVLMQIREQLAAHGEVEKHFEIEIRDSHNEVCAVVKRNVYIARKDYYQQKRREKS